MSATSKGLSMASVTHCQRMETSAFVNEATLGIIATSAPPHLMDIRHANVSNACFPLGEVIRAMRSLSKQRVRV